MKKLSASVVFITVASLTINKSFGKLPNWSQPSSSEIECRASE